MKMNRRGLLLILLVALSSCNGSDNNNSSSSSSNAAHEGACAPLPPATSPKFEARLEGFLNHYCYRQQQWRHDPMVRTTNGVHPFSKIWYSPSLWRWLTVDQRQGDVPDGAVLVKEQYPELTAKINGWSIMVKDAAVSWDGWYWAALSTPTSSQKITFDPNPSGGCAEIPVAFVGVGNTNGTDCINCHASAVNLQSTYANPANVLSPTTVVQGPGGLSARERWALTLEAAEHIPARAPRSLDRPPSSIFGSLAAASFSYPCMVPETFDHVISSAKPVGPEEFLTSDQCSSCHDATGTLSPIRPDLPTMMFPDATEPLANVSPYGEWRYSMMGLSGRDPIFFAQLDTETTLHANLQNHLGTAPEFIEDLCLHCHGVMGQRQFHIDNGSGGFFTRPELNDTNSKYGALGRDGVSCTVCHHVSPDGLGTSSTFTGNFNVGPASEVYAQYSNPQTYPMHAALGLTPELGSQINDPGLCGSCHTIILPVYDSQGNQVMENGQPKTFYEQATFLEWLNSNFSTVPCQSCHLPTQFGAPPTTLSYKIANIEDNTFPPVMFREPDPDITLQIRNPFGRHTLLGINVFALEMFTQFRKQLGLYAMDPNLSPPHYLEPVPPVSSPRTAISSSVMIATTQSAVINIPSVIEVNGNLQADVRVLNLAGHSFPSGEGFRRAFIDFQVLDRNGNVLWASGETNSDGVILGANGMPLTTEFFTSTQQTFQPHFWTGNPITSPDQVQIYEELVRDPQNMLTTSFLALDTKVKDNRY